ncbi:MAG: ABC transporter permease [Chloroflexi bacterium]|nr:MAG: ABC transporter permease [Chloroflexota bacterium]
MEELRAAIAIAKKDLMVLSRYRIAVISQIFTPLYQGVIPAFLFGAAFAVGGRAVGLDATVGTENLAGFIFLGGVISGLVATSFWAMAMGLRNEMDAGTLEPVWLTPTRHETLVIGRALGGIVWFLISQVVLFAIGIVVFGLRFDATIVLALPALVVAIVGMVGVAYLLAAIVLLIRDANFFIDCTNFLFGVASGVAFPVTLLPGAFQVVALLLPTTYAMDLLRQYAIGARPTYEPRLEYAGLILTTLVLYPLGRRFFARAERIMRVRGSLSQF